MGVSLLPKYSIPVTERFIGEIDHQKHFVVPVFRWSLLHFLAPFNNSEMTNYSNRTFLHESNGQSLTLTMF